MDTPHHLTPRSSNPTPAPRSSRNACRIGWPLRLQWLARRLAGAPGAPEAMKQALALDAQMRHIGELAGKRGLSAKQRAELVMDLLKLRVQFDELVTSALGEPRPAVGAALAQLAPEVRVRLADLLGVPLTPDFYPLLDLKAAEYIEQGRAFDQIASEFGFEPGPSLGEREPRGGLLLTHNGSLLQVSAAGAGGDPAARRFVYQNIYGGSMPTEGTLRFVRPVVVASRVRTTHMETSPVWKLRLAVRPDVWEQQRKTFDSMSIALRPQRKSLAATAWGAQPGWHPAVAARSVADARFEQNATSARAELREHLTRFADPSRPGEDPVLEADIVGLCIHLQRMRADAGKRPRRIEEVRAFVTDRGERCVVDSRAGRVDLTLERPSRKPLHVTSGGIGAQHVVEGAPVALLDALGSIAAVVGDVVWIDGSP